MSTEINKKLDQTDNSEETENFQDQLEATKTILKDSKEQRDSLTNTQANELIEEIKEKEPKGNALVNMVVELFKLIKGLQINKANTLNNDLNPENASEKNINTNPENTSSLEEEKESNNFTYEEKTESISKIANKLDHVYGDSNTESWAENQPGIQNHSKSGFSINKILANVDQDIANNSIKAGQHILIAGGLANSIAGMIKRGEISEIQSTISGAKQRFTKTINKLKQMGVKVTLILHTDFSDYIRKNLPKNKNPKDVITAQQSLDQYLLSLDQPPQVNVFKPKTKPPQNSDGLHVSASQFRSEIASYI